MLLNHTTGRVVSRLAALSVVSLALGALATPAAESHSRHADRFRAELTSVNSPDADGRARLTLEHGRLSVRLKARDLDGGIHIAHVHGMRQAQNECPTLANDSDGNGLVDLAEGVPAYGPVQRTLSDGLNDTGERIKYRRSYKALDDGSAFEVLGDLSQYAVVVHGVDLDGDGLADNGDVDGDNAAGDPNPHSDNEISMPALCGVIEHH